MASKNFLRGSEEDDVDKQGLLSVEAVMRAYKRARTDAVPFPTTKKSRRSLSSSLSPSRKKRRFCSACSSEMEETIQREVAVRLDQLDVEAATSPKGDEGFEQALEAQLRLEREALLVKRQTCEDESYCLRMEMQEAQLAWDLERTLWQSLLQRAEQERHSSNDARRRAEDALRLEASFRGFV